jgi:uncharacterized protein
MKRLGKVMLALLVLIVLLFLALCWFSSSRLICPSRRPLQDYHQEMLAHPAAHGLRIESFKVGETPCLMCEPLKQPVDALKGRKIRDQLAAKGVALPTWGEIKATLILLHGHTGRKEDHLPVAERFCAAGFRCLLPDLPGHGDHPARYASFGVHEASLPQELLREASARFGFESEPCALFGISQGGAIALQAAVRPGEKWFAVAELSAFSSLDDVVDAQARRLFGVLHPLAHGLVVRLVQSRAGYAPTAVRPVDAASKLTIPVLIGHGDEDRFVPPDHARRLFDAVPGAKKQFLNIEAAGHHNVLITEAPVYATIAEFFTKAME